MDEQVLLTPEETAELLRVEPSDVVALVEDGSLAGLQVRGHWRITFQSVKQFVSQNLQQQNLKALEHTLQIQATWVKALKQSPELGQQIRCGSFVAGSMGAFLQEALAASEGGTSGNVVRFPGPNNVS